MSFVDHTADFIAVQGSVSFSGGQWQMPGYDVFSKLSASGSWPDGYRPAQMRITTTCAADMPFAFMQIWNASEYTQIGGDGGYVTYLAGTHAHVFDLTFAGSDLKYLRISGYSYVAFSFTIEFGDGVILPFWTDPVNASADFG
ncbi:MAG: hypothetical protein PHT88_04815 [Candidatus Moranbacteria bacterium]|nr:hypothetical protein [Candidatus Moranbacteria bacterium]